MAKKLTFKDDHRKTNPGLHLLYVEWGMAHLRSIDAAIRKFHSFSNCNMYGPIEALQNARDSLVSENAAYNDADRLLKVARNKQK